MIDLLDGYKTLGALEDGETVNRPVYVTALENAVDRNGKPYVKFRVTDGESIQSASLFDNNTVEKMTAQGIHKGCIADATIRKSGEYFNISVIRPTADSSLTSNDFAKLPPVDLDKMYTEICELIKSTPNPKPECTPLSVPTLALLEKHKKAFMTSTAAKFMHHNYKGGLLYHTYRMVKAADAMCGIYSELDKVILGCGAALHDIGKIKEYDTDPVGASETTEFATLYGHPFLGAMFFSGECGKDGNKCDKERQRLLTHLILSHHGQGEWGAVKMPATPEAFALHYIDNLDAKIESCNLMYEQTEPGKNTDKKLLGYSYLYKPSYFDDENK